MKTTQEIYEQMLAVYEEKTGFAMDGSCDLAVRLYAAAVQLEELYAYADWSRRQAFPQTAEGEYLDAHGSVRVIYRQKATYAQGEIEFSLAAARTTEVTVPKGTVVVTAGQVRLATTEAAVIAPGELSCLAPAQAEEAGSAGNIKAGTAVQFVSAPVYLSACAIRTDFTGGRATEDDETYRQRVLQGYRAVDNGASAGFYEAIALSHTEVVACQVMPRVEGRGSVGLVIAVEGGQPDAGLLEEIRAELEAQRELAVDVYLSPPTIRALNVAVTLWPAKGVTYAQAAAGVEQAIRGYFTGRLLGLNVYLAKLGSLIYNTGLVENYAIAQPQADETIEPNELPQLASLVLTEGT